MKILFTLPHVFNPSRQGKYGSTSMNSEPRLCAFNSCVAAIHQLFAGQIHEIDYVRQQIVPIASESTCEIEIVVLTTRGLHLLDQVDVPGRLFHHLELDVEPMMLEFECQRVLAEAQGDFDYYCFLEDDCIICDSLFFRKLTWFAGRFGDASLLQPNRYELGDYNSRYRKLYIDGNVKSTAKYQDVIDVPELQERVLDSVVHFIRPSNPHAGSYFLNSQQMKVWSEQPHFLDRDTSLVGPLESAATLGIMRTFRIYKAAPPNRDFFEIRHSGTNYLEPANKGSFLSNKHGLRKWFSLLK